MSAMYSSITLIHSTLLIFQARLHEVQRRCSVKSAHDAPMMPETITPRMVAVCDAVNRSKVSSSSSATYVLFLQNACRVLLGFCCYQQTPAEALRCACGFALLQSNMAPSREPRFLADGLVQLRQKRSTPDACRCWRKRATVQHGDTAIMARRSVAARCRSSSCHTSLVTASNASHTPN